MIDQQTLRAKYNPEGSKLRELQHQLMDIMMVLDKICRENDIPYMLTGGNVLGAVRHGGFIPWDDDLDISLLKKDYKRLLKVLRNYNSDDYVLQEHRSEPDFIQTCPKFRAKRGDLLGSNPNRGSLYKYKGVAIDIFCIAPISYLNARISASIHRRLLSWTYIIKKPSVRHFVTDFLWGLEKVIFFFCNFFNIFRKPGELHHAQAQGVTHNMNYDDLLPFTRMPYEGEMLPMPRDTDKFLTLYFGPDYMELPKQVIIHNKELIN